MISPQGLWRIQLYTLGASVLLLVIALTVLAPIFYLFVNSFDTSKLGQQSIFGYSNWLRIFSFEKFNEALFNTITLSITRQTIGMSIGVIIAWLIARTNLPYKNILEVGFWVALFMPALPVTLSWIMLATGRSGLLNQLAMMLPFVDRPIFNVYSWWGIVWVHIITTSIAIKVFLLVPAFRALNSALEEAARIAGASLLATVWKIVIPILAPTLLVVLLVSIVRSMQAFEVELILGSPKGISVYSTIIYGAMTREPPEQGLASALSLVFILSIIPFVILQQTYVNRYAYASISGKFQSRIVDLGGWKWPIFTLITVLLLFMTVVPFTLLTIGTFMNMFGNFKMDHVWTLDNWERALSDSQISSALFNTLTLSSVSAICGMIAFTLVAYVTVKRKFKARRWLDFFSWIPALIPGLVLSLGLLQIFTSVPFLRPLYGTTAILVAAILLGTITIGTQVLRGAFLQIGQELEEAAEICGASQFYTFRRILLPLISPTVIVVGLEIFATANAAIGVLVLLSVGATQPLSLLQLALLDSGRFEPAAVIGVIIMTLTLTSAILARVIGRRSGATAQVQA